jgi:thioredoxin reductase (NADPH)
VSNKKDNVYDVVVIGAGPAGIATAVMFKQAGLRFAQFDSGNLAQTIHNFPMKIRLNSLRRNLEIAGIPLGRNPDEPPTREEYLEYLEGVVRRFDLPIMTQTIAEDFVNGGIHHVLARKGDRTRFEYRSRNIVIATGGFLKPISLDIPGEEQENVSHYFRTEQDLRGMRVLIVGARNSAIEAAITLVQNGADVVLAYRGSRIPWGDIKSWLISPFKSACRKKLIRVIYRTVPVCIQDSRVELETDGSGVEILQFDHIYLLTGYGPDYKLLRNAGVSSHATTGRPIIDSRTLKTRVSGIFLCGTVILRWRGERTSIENTREQGKIILSNLR